MKMPTSIHLLIIAVVLLVVGSNAEEEQHSGVRAFTAKKADPVINHSRNLVEDSDSDDVPDFGCSSTAENIVCQTLAAAEAVVVQAGLLAQQVTTYCLAVAGDPSAAREFCDEVY
jgi:hypothetical protein